MGISLLIIAVDVEESDATDPPHSHKCGFEGLRNHIRGCGFVFKHTDLCADSEDAHNCPVCGRGPWRTIWTPPTEVHDGKTEG